MEKLDKMGQKGQKCQKGEKRAAAPPSRRTQHPAPPKLRAGTVHARSTARGLLFTRAATAPARARSAQQPPLRAPNAFSPHFSRAAAPMTSC